MPEIVNCPHCEKKSRVPDELIGRKVKCPSCGEPFTAEAAVAPKAAPPKPKEETPPPRPSRRAADDDDKMTERPGQRRPARDADEDYEETPRRGRARRGRDDEDDDEEDDRRPRRSRARDEEEEDDRPRPRRAGGGNWPKVLRGLTFVLIALGVEIGGMVLLALLFAVVVGTAGLMVMNAGQAPRPGQLPPGMPGAAVAAGGGVIALAVLSLIIRLAGGGLRILGFVFCLPSPEKNGAKMLALVSLIGYGGAAACQLLAQVANLLGGAAQAAANPLGTGAGSVIAVWVGLLGTFLWLIGAICFVFYLRALALTLRDTGLARSLVTFFISACVAPVVMFVGTCIGGVILGAGLAASVQKQAQMNPNVPPAPPDASMIAGFGIGGMICVGIWLLLALGMFIWWVILLFRTRALVARRVARL